MAALSYNYDIGWVLNKKTEFAALEQEVAETAKALSHPARLAILKLLAQKNDCMCGDIVNSLPLAQSTVSQHLKYLKDAGLIRGEIDGPKSCYCLNDEKIESFKRGLAEIFSQIDAFQRQRSCC